MSRFNTLFLLFVVCLLGQVSNVAGQYGVFNPNLSDLPIIISWDDDGARITANITGNRSSNLLELTPSRYLDQIGNDLIRVTVNNGNTPVIIDLSDYYKDDVTGTEALVESSKVDVFMPKITLASFNEPNSFIVELEQFSNDSKNAKQTFIFKGLDVFFLGADDCANIMANGNIIKVSVRKCDTKYFVLKGGSLDLADIEMKIPELCNKYNDRYYTRGKTNGFVCLKDCEDDDPNAYKNISHSRGLITRYNITDFEDAPISFIDNLLITSKGVGLNLKFEDAENSKKNKIAYTAYDNYRFFPWYEFINLSFSKYIDGNQLMIRDPYNNSYIYNSKVHFSNVELIQFFKELKALISDGVQ